MLRFLIAGCSFEAFRSARTAILGELVALVGFLVGLLGWTGWAGGPLPLDVPALAVRQAGTDFVLIGFELILLGLAIYLLDAFTRSGRRAHRRASRVVRRSSGSPSPRVVFPVVRPTRTHRRLLSNLPLFNS